MYFQFTVIVFKKALFIYILPILLCIIEKVKPWVSLGYVRRTCDSVLNNYILIIRVTCHISTLRNNSLSPD